MSGLGWGVLIGMALAFVLSSCVCETCSHVCRVCRHAQRRPDRQPSPAAGPDQTGSIEHATRRQGSLQLRQADRFHRKREEAIAQGHRAVFTSKSLERQLRLHLNRVRPNLVLLFLEQVLQIWPTICVSGFVVTVWFFGIGPAMPCFIGILFSLPLPWVKVAIARQQVERTHLLGKKMRFTGMVFNKKDPSKAFWSLWIWNWLKAILTCGLSRIVSDSGGLAASPNAWLLARCPARVSLPPLLACGL